MEISDAELIQECLRGDNRAYDILVRRYQRQVYNLCYGMLGNPEDASDAAQDAFVKAYYALDKFRKDAQFLTWVFRIANNVCVDLWRKRSRHPVSSLDDDEQSATEVPSRDPCPDDLVLRDECDRLIWDAVSRLPDKYRAPLVMFYISGASIRDISQSLGRPEGTVKSDLHIARDMLRRKLEGVVVEV